jgi:hypothetical protein
MFGCALLSALKSSSSVPPLEQPSQRTASLEARSPVSLSAPLLEQPNAHLVYSFAVPASLEHQQQVMAMSHGQQQQLPHFHDMAPAPVPAASVPVGWSFSGHSPPPPQLHVSPRAQLPEQAQLQHGCSFSPPSSPSAQLRRGGAVFGGVSGATTDSYRATNLRRIKKILTDAQVPKLPSARAMRELFPIKDAQRVVNIYMHALCVRQLDAVGHLRSPNSSSARRQRPSRLNPERPLTATEIKAARVDYLRKEEEVEKQMRLVKRSSRDAAALHGYPPESVLQQQSSLQQQLLQQSSQVQPLLDSGSVLQLVGLRHQGHSGPSVAVSAVPVAGAGAMSPESYTLLPAVAESHAENSSGWLLRPSMFF